MTKNINRWVILVASCLINLCLGSVYAWSVFSSSMAEYFTARGLVVTSADLAIVYTVANSVGPITMISGGWFNDKLGPKKVIALGGIMFGGGMFASGFATSIGFLIVSYGLVAGLGLGFAYGCTISTCVKFFPDKRGLIGGITTAAYGLSSVILPPVVTAIVQRSDATVAFKIVGAVFAVIIIVCTLFLEKCPDNYMQEPTKATATVTASNDKTWKEMLVTKEFYIMLVLLTCGAFSGMMIISQASAIAQNLIGMTAALAGIAVSVLALFNSAGRILAGFLSDKIGRYNTLLVACVVSIIGLFSLYVSGIGTMVTFFLGVSLVGISFGSFMGVFPGFTADQFGAKNNSVNYGIMFIGFALAGFFGPQIMRNIYNASGVYQNAFLVAGVFSLVGVILVLVAKKQKR